MFWQECRRRIEALKDIKQSAHFKVHYNYRNPKSRIGAGTGGVRSRALVSCYIDALERLYATITSPPFSRPALPDEKLTEVYVFESSDLTQFEGQPFTDLDEDLRPYIGLPCRTDQPTVHAEHQYAATSAVHEATHVFNHALRPMHESETWRWFDEATAVFMEPWVFAGNHDHLRFAMNWSDLPEVPLDHPRHCYAAGIFAAYLAKSQKPDFLTKIWTHPVKKATALDAVADCLRQRGKQFSSDNPVDVDVVFSHYCVDSYFLWDTSSLGFLPDLYARYGERAISESFRVEPGKSSKPGAYRLDHLACRYFLLDLRDDVQEIVIKVRIPSPDGRSYLKPSLVSVRADLSRGENWKFSHEFKSGFLEFSALTGALVPSEVDHLVLVVSNCGYRSPSIVGSTVDNIQFDIEINAR
jgi:hypothetical protein